MLRLSIALLSIAVLCSVAPRARACGGLGPGESLPERPADVELGTAVAIYAATAGVTAIGAPLAAWAIDERDAFPLWPSLGISLGTGFAGWAIASLASVSLDSTDCGGPTELYPERVALLDLVPLSLAAAPTLIAWPLSGASTEADRTVATLSVGALADPRRHALLFARLTY